jgi:hypothetical protein
MYMQPLDRQLFGMGGLLDRNGFSSANGGMFANGLVGDASSSGNDGISRLIPSLGDGLGGGLPAAPFVGLGPGIGPLLQSIMGMLRQLGQMISGNGSGASGSGTRCGNETFFRNAAGSSTGDPHLAFNGQRWDSMTDHPDLLNSDSFRGGLQIGTQVTQPNANGVTTNDHAWVTTDGGHTSVSLDRAGTAEILHDGTQTAIGNGQSIDLGNGETIVRDQDGTLHVQDDNGSGGRIATTLHSSNGGVDVNTQATNVDLGGDLVSGGSAPRHWPHRNESRHTLPVYQRTPDEAQ